MLEDEQRFEELEAKLAALSSQVEGLELEKEVDPFLEDDVRRLIEDFREKEIAQLEEEDDLDDSDDQGSGNDFIDVQTTGGRTFKVHWIAPDSCDNMTKVTARAAFAAGAAERYGTSQQVNSGDVLILLCRNPLPTEEEPAASSKVCQYIGMAVNTGLSPTSAEPPATDVEPMTSSVGNYEIFVWSSCECSAEDSPAVILPSVFEVSSESATHGNYASISGDASPDISSADGLITSAEIRKDNATGAVDLAKGLSNTLTISTNNAGYKTELVQLSQDLTEFYLDRETKDLSFNADKKNLNAHGFESDIFTSKNLTLSNGECGNLAVSISSTSLDLALLKESSGSLDSTYLTTAKISLGTTATLPDSVAIETFKAGTDVLETSNLLEADHTVFLPIVSNTDADKILEAASIQTDTFGISSAAVTTETGSYKVSLGTVLKSKTHNFASGLITDSTSETQAAGNSIVFNIPASEVSIGNLVDLTDTKQISPYPITSLANLRASAGTYSTASYNIPILADLSKVASNFAGGLYQNSTSSNVSNVSLGSIDIPSGTTDAGVPSSSDLDISASKSAASGGGVSVNLGLAWTGNSSEYDHGLFKGNTTTANQSASDSFNITFNDLATPGNNGSAGSYIKALQNLQGSGSYNSAGGIDLSLEFESLKSQLNFIDKGFFNNETSVANGSGSWSVSIAPMTINTFPDLGEERPSDRIVTNISGISSAIDGSHSVANESKINLTGNLGVLDYTFNKGLLTGVSSSTLSGQALGSIIVPTSTSSGPVSMYTPDGTSDDYTPNLFKTTVSLGTASAFYQKKINTFSSTNALIDFDRGLADVVTNPTYTAGDSLSIDASDYSNTHTKRVIDTISVRSSYDVIYNSEDTGEARYYIDYNYKDITTTINNGLVTDITESSSTTVTEGPIIVPATPLKYSCDPTLGCQPDPSGEFDEPTCGGSCTATSDPVLTVRPANIYEYNKSGPNDYSLVDTWTRTNTSAINMHQYTNGSGFFDELQVTPSSPAPHLAGAASVLNEDTPSSTRVFLSYPKS